MDPYVLMADNNFKAEVSARLQILEFYLARLVAHAEGRDLSEVLGQKNYYFHYDMARKAFHSASREEERFPPKKI